jgi:hypothetical protein
MRIALYNIEYIGGLKLFFNEDWLDKMSGEIPDACPAFL